MPDATDRRTHLVEMPAGTPAGFPLTKSFREEWAEFETPLAESHMADLNAALVQQFLHVSVAERKPVVEPESVLDDAYRETVAVGLEVDHDATG